MTPSEAEAVDYIELMYDQKLKKKRRPKFLIGAAKAIVLKYGSADNEFEDVLLALKLIESELKQTLGCNSISWTLNYPAPKNTVSPNVV